PFGVHLAAAGGTLAVILGVSLAKVLELRAGGGAAVARMLGAEPVLRSTQDPLERRFLNVVDEMSIAAGTRVPQVFVMRRQRGINAFAAGYDISSSAVVVTRGTLEQLNRDELQAVVGHELSHVVNGDMALNIRMIGVLAGLVIIGAAGAFLMRATARSRDLRASPVALAGFGLYVVGGVGLMASRLIKAMLSREREFLADAGGVQFTRNPEALAGALDQIRRNYSWVAHLHTEDVSHLFFADAHGFLSQVMFATHPPIDARIERIAPGFDAGDYARRRAPGADVNPRDDPQVLQAAREAMGGETRRPVAPESIAWGLTASQAMALVGNMREPDVAGAHAFLASLPERVRRALDDPPTARAVVVALILAREEAARSGQLAAVEAAAGPELAREAADIQPLVAAVAPEMQLPVVDLALGALRKLDRESSGRLVAALQGLLDAGGRTSLYRFAYVAFVRSQLEPTPAALPLRYRSLAQMRDAAGALLSLVAHAGCADAGTADADFARAFEAGAAEAGLVGQVVACPRGDCTPELASRSLEALRDLEPLDKARLVKGLFAAITADGRIRRVEAALLRMIGGVLDCPLPPLLYGLPRPGARTFAGRELAFSA
ncbi:MAG TPA: M48 family metalloprotease, partial [Usitatibacter sp.]|nr:M48 family metalloprotease [Usitatibacter sp.]